MTRKKQGLHEQLSTIVNQVRCTDLGHDLDGKFFFDAKDRAYVRKIAAYLVDLMDKYDRLDPL